MRKNFLHKNPFVLYGICFFIVITVAGLFLGITGQWERMQSKEPKPSVGAYPDDLKTNEPDLFSGQKASKSSAAIAERNEIASRLREQVKAIYEERNTLAQLALNLKSSFSLLMDNSTGRKIASSSDLVDRFVLCEDEFQKTNADLADVLSVFEILQLRMLEAADSPQASNLGLATETAELRKKALGIRTRLEDQEFRLERIVNDANQLQSSDVSLKGAINIQRAAGEESQVRLFKSLQKQELEKRAAEQIAFAKERMEAESQLQNAQEVSKIEELKAQAEAEKKRSELANKRMQLEVEFERDLPKIQHYLGVLFKHSPRQIVRGSVVGVKDSGPVSLSGLKSFGSGGLGDDYQKETQGLLLFFSYYEAGGRGSGPYPAGYAGGHLDAVKQDAIRPAYLLLEKYGLLLVEKGMLAP